MDFGLHFGIILVAFWHSFSILFRHWFLHAFLDAVFRLFVENGFQNEPGKRAGCRFWSCQNASKTHQLRNLDFSLILDWFWAPFWSAAPRRGGERVRLLESIRYFQVSSAPLTPRHGQNIEPKSMKSAVFIFFLASNFGINFRIPFFLVFFLIFDGFWLPFWMHFGIMFHTFCMPFSSIDVGYIFDLLFMNLCLARTTS